MLVEINHLTKVYHHTTACENICLSLEEGQVFGLLGPNGAGKSTLVKMLCGLVRPTSGQAYVEGLPVSSTVIRKRTGYMPELFRYYSWMSAGELLDFYARVYEIPLKRRSHDIHSTLELVGLLGREKDKIAGFSKGMQQRLGLAVAIIHRPCLVFLDEPTSALDPIGRREVRTIISRLREQGTTVFLNSHLLGEVEMTCTHLGFINHGCLLASGPIRDFMQESCDLAIEALGIDDSLLDRWKGKGRQFTVTSGGVQVKIQEAQEIPGIVEEMVKAGARIYKVESSSRGLEEVFMDYMDR